GPGRHRGDRLGGQGALLDPCPADRRRLRNRNGHRRHRGSRRREDQADDRSLDGRHQATLGREPRHLVLDVRGSEADVRRDRGQRLLARPERRERDRRRARRGVRSAVRVARPPFLGRRDDDAGRGLPAGMRLRRAAGGGSERRLVVAGREPGGSGDSADRAIDPPRLRRAAFRRHLQGPAPRRSRAGSRRLRAARRSCARGTALRSARPPGRDARARRERRLDAVVPGAADAGDAVRRSAAPLDPPRAFRGSRRHVESEPPRRIHERRLGEGDRDADARAPRVFRRRAQLDGGGRATARAPRLARAPHPRAPERRGARSSAQREPRSRLGRCEPRRRLGALGPGCRPRRRGSEAPRVRSRRGVGRDSLRRRPARSDPARRPRFDRGVPLPADGAAGAGSDRRSRQCGRGAIAAQPGHARRRRGGRVLRGPRGRRRAPRVGRTGAAFRDREASPSRARRHGAGSRGHRARELAGRRAGAGDRARAKDAARGRDARRRPDPARRAAPGAEAAPPRGDAAIGRSRLVRRRGAEAPPAPGRARPAGRGPRSRGSGRAGGQAPARGSPRPGNGRRLGRGMASRRRPTAGPDRLRAPRRSAPASARERHAGGVERRPVGTVAGSVGSGRARPSRARRPPLPVRRDREDGMTPLAPKLFDRRYDDFRRLGLSLLPALAPGWTDYNAHDPGITLVELLAWVAEAQLYSVGRMRRDERVSYAALLGVAPGGRRPAHGLIWADRSDPASPAATFAGTRVIDVDAAVRLERHDEPVFHPERKTLWVPGRIVRLSSRRADGTVVDLTATNARGAPFLPFGDSAGPRDVLSLEFETGGDDGLFPALRAEANGATWAIGVRATAPAPADDADAASPPHDVAVALVAGSARFPLRVVADSTAGLLRTGRLVLDVSRVGGSPKRFRIELRVPRGFACPPQWSRIEPSVLEITERQTVDRELHFANDEPNVEVDLGRAGLSFEPRSEPLQCVEVRTETDILEWSRCDRLEDRGPDDRVYELDPVRGRLAFGNGVNGRKPGAGAEIYVTYAVCSGEEGNVSRGHRWTVVGFPGAFGVNPEPIAGGAERPAWS